MANDHDLQLNKNVLCCDDVTGGRSSENIPNKNVQQYFDVVFFIYTKYCRTTLKKWPDQSFKYFTAFNNHTMLFGIYGLSIMNAVFTFPDSPTYVFPLVTTQEEVNTCSEVSYKCYILRIDFKFSLYSNFHSLQIHALYCYSHYKAIQFSVEKNKDRETKEPRLWVGEVGRFIDNVEHGQQYHDIRQKAFSCITSCRYNQRYQYNR